MHYRFEIKPKLEKKLKKIQKKDPVMFKAARDKIERIIRNPPPLQAVEIWLKRFAESSYWKVLCSGL